MNFKFYDLGDINPSFEFIASGEGLYDSLCEQIVDHVLGADPYSESPARDIFDIVEMQTPDESEYVEAVYVQGKLVGSLNGPFWLDPSEYVKI